MLKETTATADHFFDQIEYLPIDDRLQVRQAYDLARREHGYQRRKDGELYFSHPRTVASYVAGYRLEAAAVEAALLHDIVEDTAVSVETVEGLFGRDVAHLVDGVTKLKEVTRKVAKGRQLTDEELRNATLRKLLRAMTTDVRTVVIKLLDRLHNMRTIKAMSPGKQIEKAQETLDVYAPLAYRLGMWEIKSELQALSLEVLDPEAYHTLLNTREELQREHQALFEIVSGQAMECLLDAGIDVRGIRLAPEHIYTTYQDIHKSGASYHAVDRTMRIVVLVDDTNTCYSALGFLHQLWRAVPYSFDDYISVRRENLYQSLHTTVVHSSGERIKIRLRTEAMDEVAQVGVLARWLFDGTPQWSTGMAQPLDEFFDAINNHIDVEPDDVIGSIRGVFKDVLGTQIRVYTPRGEGKDLPQGATAIDFAYKIHSELGDQTMKAYATGQSIPLNRPLPNGSLVLIIKNERGHPQRTWLDEDLGYITTSSARSQARRWFRRLPEDKAVKQGQQLLEHELTMLGVGDEDHGKVAALNGYESTYELYYALGRAELLPTELSTRIMTANWEKGAALDKSTTVQMMDGSRMTVNHGGGRELRLCSTCHPRPGDPIRGYLRQDGRVTVHHETCRALSANQRHLGDVDRRMKLTWGDTKSQPARQFKFHIDVFDRPGLLYEITQLMHGEEINIPDICTTRSGRWDELLIELEMEVSSPRQMVRILHQTEALVNVKSVCCVPEPDPEQPAPTYYKPE